MMRFFGPAASAGNGVTADGHADDGSFVRGSTVAGGFFGAIYELPNDVVLGIEADFFVAGLNGSLQNQRFVAGVDIDWLARIRARLGYPIDSFLLFVTASLTLGEVGASLDIPSVRMSWRERSVETGWSATGGFEYAVSPNLPLRADAVCFDLGTRHRRWLLGQAAPWRLRREGRVGLPVLNHFTKSREVICAALHLSRPEAR